MKRSKIFLGVTTGLLAVAGLAAAKRYGPAVSRFYCTTGNKCVSTGTSTFTAIPTLLSNHQSTAKLATLTYRTGPNTTGTAIVYTAGTLGISCTPTTGCLTPLYYTKNN